MAEDPPGDSRFQTAMAHIFFPALLVSIAPCESWHRLFRDAGTQQEE